MPGELIRFEKDGKLYRGVLEDTLARPVVYCTSFVNDFIVPINTDYVLPFTTFKFEPDPLMCEVKLATALDLEFYIKPLVEGFYHVDGLFRDTGMVTPTPGVLKIGGGDGIEEVDYFGAPTYYGQGSRIVYCDGANDIITLEIRHAINPGTMFNRLAVPGANGYICVHYCGFPKSATL